MNLKQELQQLNIKLDKSRRKLTAAEQRFDTAIVQQARLEIAAHTKKIESLKASLSKQLSAQGSQIKAMKFNRALSKAEQADMGKLKKSVRGLVVVHPMTALGRELGLSEVHGYAPKPF